MGNDNTLSALLPKLLARGLMVLRSNAVMPRLVNSDYGALAAKKGTTIDVPVSVVVGTTGVTPSSTPITPTGVTPTTVQIVMNQWRQNNPVVLSDKDIGDIEASETFLPLQLLEAVKALADEANLYIYSRYATADRGIYQVAGANAGTTPFDGTYQTVRGATLARKRLSEGLAPRSMRRGVVDLDAEENMLTLSQFSDAEKIMSAVVKIEGDIGRKYGIDWVADSALPTHTAGTLSSPIGTLDVDATEPEGEDEIAIVSSSASDDTKTILKGDIVTFDTHSQTYVVTEDVTMSGQAAVVKIYPGLTEQISAGDNAVITVAISHVLNMAFQRDAFAFAMRPLEDTKISNLGTQLMTLQDAVTGLVMRLEVSRQHKQVIWEYDILYGAELVRPSLATRIWGQSS